MHVYEKTRGGEILKDGHTMFKVDIVNDLNRMAYLESQRTSIIEVCLKNKSGGPKVIEEIESLLFNRD